MSSVRRALTALTAAVIAVLVGNTPALAGPAPLIEPEPAPAGTGGSAGAQFFEGLLPVVLVIAALVVVAVAGSLVARIQHHRRLPTTA